MGTHCVTQLIEQGQGALIAFYRHYDGYPAGHGAELLAFLSSFGKAPHQRKASGAGCLAAQMIAHFKSSRYGKQIIMLSPSEGFDMDEDWTYQVYVSGEMEISVTVWEKDSDVFEGDLSAFYQFLTKEGTD